MNETYQFSFMSKYKNSRMLLLKLWFALLFFPFSSALWNSVVICAMYLHNLLEKWLKFIGQVLLCPPCILK